MALIFLSALAVLAGSSQDSATLEVCRPALARKIDGNISVASVTASSSTGRWRIVRGKVTSLIGMGAAGPGMASAHHLIRADYNFVCWVHRGHVSKIEISQLQ